MSVDYYSKDTPTSSLVFAASAKPAERSDAPLERENEKSLAVLGCHSCRARVVVEIEEPADLFEAVRRPINHHSIRVLKVIFYPSRHFKSFQNRSGVRLVAQMLRGIFAHIPCKGRQSKAAGKSKATGRKAAP